VIVTHDPWRRTTSSQVPHSRAGPSCQTSVHTPRPNRPAYHSGSIHCLTEGVVVSTFGIALGLKSLWGLLLTLFVFVPLGVYRARLEEQALARKFGPAWEAYARRTDFMLPLL
jgi:hypothetical protein